MSQWESAGKSNEWYTPKYIFDALGVRFDMDVAAPEDRTYCHVPTDTFLVADSLEQAWSGFVWMNPPFSGRNGLVPWFAKIAQHDNGIGLCPDRTSAPWWQKVVKRAECTFFIANKVKFIRPDGSTGNQPGNGTTLFGYGDRARNALLTAEDKGLGTLLVKLRHR